MNNSTRARSVIEKAANANFFQGWNNSIEQYTDPLVTGYAFIKFMRPVAWVNQEYPGFFSFLEKDFKSFSGVPDSDITTQGETMGFTANETLFVTGIAKGQGFTMTHNEYSGSPVASGYELWISGVRDPNTNIATYPAKYRLDYTARNHTAQLIYMVTRPDADNTSADIIEHAAFVSNVMPLSIKNVHFSYTSGTQEVHVLEQNFTGDFYKSRKVLEAAKGILRSNAIYKTVRQEDVLIPGMQ